MDDARGCDHPPFNPYFMFATGIDSACPRVGGRRLDQFERCGHYARIGPDIDLVCAVGSRYLRYGPPLHQVLAGPGRYDWGVADEAFRRIRAHDLVPIAELCRFGVPDWIGDFQNPDFPDLFAAYARAFAERFPWVQLYTPVSQIFVCALFSGRLGRWNEALSSDAGFVTALKHLAGACVLAMRAILEVRPDALFIQSERAGYYHAESPEALGPAEFLNSLRFLAFDLSYGHRVDSEMYEYLRDNGMSQAEYDFFMGSRLVRHCVMGADYYPENERRVRPDGSRDSAGEVLGFAPIARLYHARYGLPVMHTETSCPEGADQEGASAWLRKEWANALRLRNSGVPLVGFTWYPLIDQVDWTNRLEPPQDGGHATGLYDLDRRLRPVGRAYRGLMDEWRQVLPAQSVCLIVPVTLPSEYDEPMALRRREWVHRFYAERSDAFPPSPFGRSAVTTP